MNLWIRLLLLSFLPVALQAAKPLHVELVDNPPVEVNLESFLDETPPAGFAPVLVSLRNRTPSAQSFRLSYESQGGSLYSGGGHTVTGSVTLEVDAQGRSQTYVYIPVLGQGDSSEVMLTLYGPGVRGGSSRIQLDRRWNRGEAYIGMGDRIAKHWSSIETDLRSSSGRTSDLTGTKISPASTPADWRAYVAFSSLWFSMAEWEDLDPGARAAITEWVGLGGRLYFVLTQEAQRNVLQFPGAIEGKFGNDPAAHLGLGRIVYLNYAPSQEKAFVARAVAIIRDEKHFSQNFFGRRAAYASGQLDSPYASDWGLANTVGKLDRNVGTLSVFMIIFALVIGPVNFFLLAPSRRRYRILWTTPLIALAASLVLALIILVSDGTGGHGARLTLACLLPDQKRLLIKQEQVSRTGLLLGDAFEFERNAELDPISLSDSRDSGSYAQTATGWSGNWFSSRARQAQFAQTVRAARGGVHVTLPAGDDPGSVIAALEISLAEIYLVSPDGKAVYKATNLLPGTKRPLESVLREDFEAWWKKYSEPAGAILKDDLALHFGKAGWFFARAENPAALALTTLDAIEWRDDTALVRGPAMFETKTTGNR